MLVPTLRQYFPQTLALRGAPLLGLRAFSLTAPAFKTTAAVKTRKRKASANSPPKKILKKDLKIPFEFPGTRWTDFVREHTKGTTGSVSTNGSVQLASEKWAQMTQEEKDKYGASKEELNEYYAKKKEWKASLPMAARKMLAVSKRPGQVNVYSRFVQENYDKSIPFGDNIQAIKTKWANTSDAEKLAYKERAKQAKKAAQDAQSNL